MIDTRGVGPARILLLILVASFFLRVWLILAGGQLFFPDELLYERARVAVDAALSGDIKGFFAPLRYADKFGNTLIWLVPAAIGKAVSQDPRLPPLLLCVFGIVNIWLLWKISLRTGAGESEALVAAFLLSVSTTLFYYSRHLLPYDLSMTFGLLALLVAIREPSKKRDSFLCGLLSSACFLIYGGYWTLSAFTLLLHTFYLSRSPNEMVRRAVLSGTAFAAPFLIIVLPDALYGGNMFFQFISFTRTVTQGSYAEGWSLPFEYLWHAEHFLLVLWLAGLAYCLWEARKRTLTKQAAIGIAGILFIYGTLVVLSVGFEKFVVYGRLVRQCVPFFCLMTAHWMIRLAQSGTMARRPLAALFVLILIQAGFNFYPPLVQVFPGEFKRKADDIISLSGQGKYDLLYAHYIFPEPKQVSLGSHEVLLQSPHPLEFLPYQYEGYTPENRRVLRSTDISMRLIRDAKQWYIP